MQQDRAVTAPNGEVRAVRAAEHGIRAEREHATILGYPVQAVGGEVREGGIAGEQSELIACWPPGGHAGIVERVAVIDPDQSSGTTELAHALCCWCAPPNGR
ncbi:hypothetical protein GCM10009693_04280 [Leucobacter chromiireducens subsp. chromiireducens]